MVRVPTYASYMTLLNQAMINKSLVNQYSYQATSGIKYANYSGYGMTASNIVNMEASLSVTQNFYDNNTVLNTSITAMSTVMDTIENAASSFKSQLNASISALSNLKQGEPVTAEISSSISELQMVAFSTMSLLSDALNQSIGGKYIFGAGSSSAPTEFNFTTLEEFQNYYDGINIKYPSTTNANLSSRDASWKNSGNLTISENLSTYNSEALNSFFNTVVVGGADTTGNLTLSSNDNTLQSDIEGTFDSVKAGDVLKINDGNSTQSYEVKSVSADGKTVTFKNNVEFDPTDPDVVGGVKTYTDGMSGTENVVISASSANIFTLESQNGFLTTAVVGNENTTGTLTLSADDDTLHAEVYGAFNTISAGDTLMINDGTATKAYVVESVSSDGKTITFADDITFDPADPDVVDGVKTYTDGQSATGSVTISTSFAQGTILNYSDVDGTTLSPMQVIKLNDDGSLVVSANDSLAPMNIAANKKWELSSESYYVGGSAEETFRVSDSQTVTFDINANDSVFEKLFRSLGAIAQGNMIQVDGEGNVTNADDVTKLVNEAMSFLQSAIDNNGKSTNGKNETISLVIAKVSANYVTLDNVQKTLESLQSNLEESIYDIKNVDKTEATVKLLEAQNSLEASYSVLSNVLNLSLLNYLD